MDFSTLLGYKFLFEELSKIKPFENNFFNVLILLAICLIIYFPSLDLSSLPLEWLGLNRLTIEFNEYTSHGEKYTDETRNNDLIEALLYQKTPDSNTKSYSIQAQMDDEREYKNYYEEVLHLVHNYLMKDGFWEDGIYVKYTRDKKNTTEQQSVDTKRLNLISFRSLENIDQFIQKKKRLYAEEKIVVDNELKFLQTDVIACHERTLNNSFSMSEWIHPRKKEIKKYLDNYLSGHINKLGILLHGAAGCGKTSFIKALSQYMNKHVVSVNLNRTKERLLEDLFYDDTLSVYGGAPVGHMPRSSRIIVFEEVDTCTDELHDREKFDDYKSKGFYSDLPTSFIKNDNDKNEKENKKIKLHHLLNIFDGINELRDVIYVFTTNYVDVLDRALVRSGRFDLNVEVKPFGKSLISQYLEKHYGAGDYQKLASTLLEQGYDKGSDVNQLCKNFTLKEIRRNKHQEKK